MKYLLTALFLSAGLVNAAEYSPNDGDALPDTFTQKSNVPEKQEATTASPVSSDSGIINSTGVDPDEMNPSPNPAPSSDKEAIENTTLTRERIYETGPYTPEDEMSPGQPSEIQAQEEDALDYSTTPEKRPTDKKK